MNNSRWDLGKGGEISLWFDRWIPNNNALSTLVVGPVNLKDLNLNIYNIIKDKMWSLNDFSLELPTYIKNLVKAVHIPQNSFPRNRNVWDLTEIGAFSKKLASNALRSHNSTFMQTLIIVGYGNLVAPTKLNSYIG